MILAELSAHRHADIVAAERELKQAEAIGTALEKMKRGRAIALTEARESAAADSASQEATLSTSFAGEALQAARADAMRHHRRIDAGGKSTHSGPAPAGGLILAPAGPGPTSRSDRFSFTSQT